MPLVGLCVLAWLVVLGTILRRADLDSVTKLTWIIVVIFVPFFGILLYWFIDPIASRREIDPSNQLSGTPWENDSSHTRKGKPV